MDWSDEDILGYYMSFFKSLALKLNEETVKFFYNDKSQQSWPKYNTHDPIIEQGFVSLVKRPYTDELRIDVIDTAGKKDEVLGSCTINVWRDLVEQPGLEQPLRPWILKGSYPGSKIVMSASLRGLLTPESSPRKKPDPSQVRKRIRNTFVPKFSSHGL